MIERLKRLLNPKSIAIVGGEWADALNDQVGALGYSGAVYRIHPSRANGDASEYHPNLDALPEIPDAVFLAVNRETTVEMLKTMNRIGAGAAICLANGFDETHSKEGLQLTIALKEAAGEVPFLGPNCYGLVNFFDRVVLMPDQIPPEFSDTGVCVIAQSGTVAQNIMYARRSLPLGYVICTGNETCLAVHHLVDLVLDDSRVTAIGLYIESFQSLEDFASCVDRAHDKGVPIVVVKAGRSVAAQRTAYSHTGAMGTEEAYMDAFFEQIGVIRCSELSELTETLKFLHVHGPIVGKNIMVCGYSGGEMAIASDLVDQLDLELPSIPMSTQKELRDVLGDRVTLSNPLDMQTFIWRHPEKSKRCFTSLMRAGFDCTVLFLDHPDSERLDATLYEDATHAFLSAALETDATAVFGNSYAEASSPEVRRKALRSGVAPLQGMSEVLRAIANAKAGRIQSKDCWPSLKTVATKSGLVILSEAESKRVLGKAGLPVSKYQEVPVNRALEAASEIGFPVVLKVSAKSLPHKSDVGGVALNLRNPSEVELAAKRMSTLSDTVLVEPMIEHVVAELIIGIDVDPQFGPVILIGTGGVSVENEKDIEALLPPLTETQIKNAISRLRIAKLLDGFRGTPPGDVAAIVNTVLTLEDFATRHIDMIAEIDINPLIVRVEGRGVVAADVFIRCVENSLDLT